jgi:predicted RNA binding protein YcfA (HicA-like mRNA interferase family)
MFTSVMSKGHARWQKFVAAMNDAGFKDTNAGGSIVTFKHKLGTINFHRPHPDDNIHSIKLRGMGKRLTRRFGWGMDDFTERRKGGKNSI